MARRWPERWLRLVVGAACGVVFAALAVSTAFADPGHARISLGSSSAPPGAAVDGSGSGFSASGSAVQITFGGPSGPALWEGAPAANGSISFSFTVPNAAPGSYSIVATQSQGGSGPVSGTSARTTLVVTAATDPPTPGTSLVPTQPQPADPPAPSTAPASPSAAPADPAAGAAPTPTATPAFSSVRPRPPQVATLWRVGGADPSWMTGFAVSAAVSQTTSPLVPLGAGVAIVVSTLATGLTLRWRSDDRAGRSDRRD